MRTTYLLCLPRITRVVQDSVTEGDPTEASLALWPFYIRTTWMPCHFIYELSQLLLGSRRTVLKTIRQKEDTDAKSKKALRRWALQTLDAGARLARRPGINEATWFELVGWPVPYSWCGSAGICDFKMDRLHVASFLPAVSSVAAAVAVVITIAVIRRCRHVRKKVHKKFMSKISEEISKRIRDWQADPDAAGCMEDEVVLEIGPMEKFLHEILNEKPMRFSSEQLGCYTKGYSSELGSGGFGVVYKGELPNGLQVAVKVLKMSMNKKVQEGFMAEIGTIGRTYHVHLVRLYGFCFEKDSKALVYEFLEGGSLEKYLYHNDDEEEEGRKRLEWRTLHEIAVGTAKVIRYLHEECQQRIVHYDIKPANILLTADFVPKVSDFGLARLGERENTHMSSLTGGGRGTPGYAAPELWKALPTTEKCDVYSFGMVLFEVLGRRRNYDLAQAESRQWFPKWVWDKYEQRDMDTIVSAAAGVVGEEDREMAETLCKVALWCVQFQPATRPTMSSVVRMLEGEMPIVPPVNPFHYVSFSGSGGENSSGSALTTGSTFLSSSRDTGRDSEPVSVAASPPSKPTDAIMKGVD